MWLMLLLFFILKIWHSMFFRGTFALLFYKCLQLCRYLCPGHKLDPVSSVKGDKFSGLLPYLNSGRKTIIHCWTLDQVFHVYAYIWQLQPEGANKLVWEWLYHSVCPPEYNKETIQLIDTDPNCFITTIAFSNGLNAKSLLDSLSLGFAMTFDKSWQEKGCVGRNPEMIGQGIIFSHHSIIVEVESCLACE